MTDKRIDAHTNTTTVADVDEFIVDSGSNGTRNITYSNLKSQILGSTSIATIGNSVTEAIYNTYTDIGDLTQTGVTGATVAAQISQLNAEIGDITDGQFNVWFPDLYDYNTKIKTLTGSDCSTYIKNIGDMTIAWVFFPNISVIGSISTMLQFRNFPNGCTWCLGGTVYGIAESTRSIQASNIGVYFRPNIIGSPSGVFSTVLFFAKLT